MKAWKTTLMALALAAATTLPAYALDLQGARRNGQVGEKQDGYIAALQPAADVQALVASVNAKRQDEYRHISQQNGQPVDVVAKLAAQQIIAKLPAGSSYQAQDGSWKKR